ncbi:MerR family transcriptional regulator [Pseudonocardia sp. KRD-184]|uniref:MerR family transcriptional regulator n=1 Tax=Pseudonocardia oceani TaxID=2792013 RepID=A0ABS6U598_9PSEU|nr:MerR family transcriptional regulator [Pseudonocardia oceani]MBW0095297.1 MerR family transcriptional regulator [Pseudonocardia oceani]MBW0121787.1 MerR family transcriptional regulator [Pseudonocardia oceani]MBW0127401.1 MerR family transcriptional regulator [Pseudonocardia oceani]
MAWSTREVAELAGTSLRAVRHYHEVGLLPEPERRANGYKQYTVAHLLRLLRITRLAELGFSLTQISAMGEDDDHPAEALRTLDAELAATIERLQRVRAELDVILRDATPTDLPPGFVPADADARLSDADRALVVVMTRVLGPVGLRAYADLLQEPAPDGPAGPEFDDLPPDADEPTRRDLAERLAHHLRALYVDHPDLAHPHTDAPGGAAFAAQTVGRAIRELYNPAQIDVMRRADALLRAGDDPAAPGPARSGAAR